MAGSSTAELSLIIKARNLASGPVDKLHKSLERAGKGVGRLGGAFVTLGKVGILGVITAIAGAIGFMGVATKAAADEQKGIARLDAALRANVKGYKGNTSAIEALIAKRETLAFSDDDLRASLSLLVTKYGNVKRAQDIQAVAMDVARLKNISLVDATALVSKGMDGNSKILKQLGITDLPKTATAQERLTAIQKKAAGQADAYGKTAAGAQEAFQIAIGDVVEDLGGALLPVMTHVFTWLRETGIPAVRGIIGAITKWMTDNKPLIDQLKNFLAVALKVVIGRVKDVVTWIGNFIGVITSNKDVMNVLRAALQAIADAASLVWSALSVVAKWMGDVFKTITENKGVVHAFGQAWDIVAKAINIVVKGLKWIVSNIGRVLGALGSIQLPDLTGITDLIPHFATGGVVGGARGEPQLAIVHGGERITAPGSSRAGSSGSPVIIALQLDGRTIARVVDERLSYGSAKMGIGTV
jgi:hypothetical protein